jgi:hypothetical protein
MAPHAARFFVMNRTDDIASRIARLSADKLNLLAQRLAEKGGRGAAIPRRDPSDPFIPLSFDQQRLWFLHQLDPDSPAYNIPAMLRMSGDVNAVALESSLNEVVKRHGSLRTTFAVQDGQPVQVIAPALEIPLPVIDLRHLPASLRADEAVRLAHQEASRPFDLTKGPLLRAALIRLDEQEHMALYVMHHIISDGASCQILIGEMAALYQAHCQGQPVRLPELPIQFADYAAWQRKTLTPETLEAQMSYWKKQLAGELPVLSLPADRPPASGDGARGGSYSFAISEDLYDRLKQLARQQGVTLFIVLLAGFEALLHYYSGQEDLVIGTDASKRDRIETEGLIGFFINQLVIRADLSGDPEFQELLGRTRAVALDAYANQDLPFDRLVEAIRPERGPRTSPLFQVKIVLQQTRTSGAALNGLKLMPQEISNGAAQLDLIMNLVGTEHDLGGVLEYNADVFLPSTIAGLADQFALLLSHVVATPDIKMSALKETLAESDRQRRRQKEEQLKNARLDKFKALKQKTIGRAR